jgi:PAS domain S-box-containing protein
MDTVHRTKVQKLIALLRKPGFWLIIALLLLITLPHYSEALGHPMFLNELITKLGLTRHAFERILYLAPIVWAGFMFGLKGAGITSLVALAVMLPRAIFLSDDQVDAIFETSAVFIIGNVLAVSFESLRRARERRAQLETTQQELRTSEQRYRGLFENAHDAIWLQDMDGNILAANTAASKLTGYDVDTLVRMNVREFLSPEGLEAARRIRRKLLQGEILGESYDQRITRKDGSEALVRLSSSPIRSGGAITGFQHIARDVTEEKRLQENLRFYLQQATRAQEEERKRISRELHDDAIQSLVVLSRQLDALATNSQGLPEDARRRIEELWQQTNSVMQGIRRLSQDLRPAALDRLGLLPTLEWLASDVGRYSGIETKVKVVGTERRLPEEVELVLFRVVQEALRNIWRHSQATQAEIVMEFGEKKLRITVTDNGKGFDLPKTIGDLARHGKLGLAGMQERAQLVGATLAIDSQPGKGTTVTVELAI